MRGISGSARRAANLTPLLRDRLVELLHGPGWRRMVFARRTAAGLLAALALALALEPGAAGNNASLLVAAHDLAPGSTLGRADLALRRWPADLVPAGALTAPETADGRVLAGAARAGEPLTDLRLAGPELAASATGLPDAASVPIRLADPDVAGLLRPGSVVDVVTLGPAAGEPVVLARDAVVLTVLPADNRIGLGGAGRGRLVLVALPRGSATRVAGASLSAQVALTLR